jgi:hypothetical protein
VGRLVEVGVAAEALYALVHGFAKPSTPRAAETKNAKSWQPPGSCGGWRDDAGRRCRGNGADAAVHRAL